MALWTRSAADGRIDAAAQAEHDLPVPHLGANPRDRFLDERGHGPVAGAAADVEREILEERRAFLRCGRPRDETAGRRCGVRCCSIAAIGTLPLVATTVKPVGRGADVIAMAGPDAQLARRALEQLRLGRPR